MNNNNDTSEFDYVIVGAGSAGCVLANRLSADGRHKVLLLEAGPKDTNIWIHVPLGYGKLFKEKSVNWMYQTEPEPGLNGRQVFQPRGKVLGGSSSINGLLYVRGQHEDYDRWRQRGNAGWGLTTCCPISSGPRTSSAGLTTSRCRRASSGVRLAPFRSAVGGLCRGGGGSRHPTNPDFNGAAQEGAGFFRPRRGAAAAPRARSHIFVPR
jgi:choline dehydrogenase